jgi:hypothetical protein
MIAAAWCRRNRIVREGQKPQRQNATLSTRNSEPSSLRPVPRRNWMTTSSP